MAKYIIEADPATGEINRSFQPVAYTEQPASTNATQVSHLVDAPVFYGGLAIIIIGFFLFFVITKQQTAKIIQRLGKFKKIATAGLSFRVPFIDWVAGKVDLRVRQQIVIGETKTKDNVFVNAKVSIQYKVIPEKVYEAFYLLNDPQAQIQSYVLDIIRSKIPALTLDELFEKKDEIAMEIKTHLVQTMDDFGYFIVDALVTDIDPDKKVKDAMNEINEQKRLREAATEKGEAEKILVVKNAEAEAESKKLQGKGIADQRKAIIEGLKDSVDMMAKAVGVSASEVMNLVLITQYFDTIKEIGDKGKNSTIFLNSSPSAVNTIAEQMREAIITSNQVK